LAVSFGILTLLLAPLGLYGVLSYGVVQRSEETGVQRGLYIPVNGPLTCGGES